MSCLAMHTDISVITYVSFGSTHHSLQWTGCCKNVKGEDPLTMRNDNYTFQVNKAIMEIIL